MAFTVDNRGLGMNDNIGNVYASGTGAINESFDPKHDYTIIGIRLHLSADGGAGDLTVQVNSELGSAFDNVLIKQDMTSISDINWFLEGKNVLLSYTGNEPISFTWANSNGRTWGLQVTYYKSKVGIMRNPNF